MKERVLITGSSGFIGSRLRERLEQQGHEVRSVKGKDIEEPNLIGHERQPGVLWFHPDWIFHLAAYGNHYDQKEMREMFSANVIRLFNLLDGVQELRHYKALVNVGTSSEYGRKSKPMNEADSLEPITMYASTKAMGTILASAWARETQRPIVSVRPFSVYGPGEATFRFIPTAIRSAMRGLEMPLAPGVHDWVYIDDFIDGMVLVAQHADKLGGQVVNIGTGVQRTNKEIINVVEKVVGQKVKINELKRLREYDTIRSWVADTTKICSLGWKPQVSLEEGIGRVYEQIKKEDS